MQECIAQLGVVVLLLGNLIASLPNANTPVAIKPPEVKETVQSVVSSPLDGWIDKLSMYESSGREDIVIVDTNGKKSYGCLQFQKATFESYSKRYGIGGDIMDCSFQKRLAKLMIEEDPKNYRHWLTSVKSGLGLPPS